MKGIIITNPFDGCSTQLYKVKRMSEEFAKLDVNAEVVSNDQFVTYINDGDIVCNTDADFVLYFDKDKYIARMLEKSGVRVFNTSRATEICDDKMLTHITLANAGIPMPTTMSGALCYARNGEIKRDYLQSAVDKLDFPIVIKECYGSYGEQVYLANSFAELSNIVEKIKYKPYLFQRFVKESSGRDMRVIVIGGKVACGMIRTSISDFRSNVQHGGAANSCDVPDNIAKLCVKTAEIIGLDYCGIDVLLSDVPQICEVNSNAMFTAMEQTTGVNVARLYAEHIVRTVKCGK